MTDDLVAALQRLDDAEYPGGRARLDPALVVRAGRHRKRARRIAGASAACVVVVAAALGGAALGDPGNPHQPIGPITTTTSAPTATASGSPTPTPSPTLYPGTVTTLPSGSLPNPTTSGVFGVPVALDPVGGAPAIIVGAGDGSVLPVVVTPMPPDSGAEVVPAYRSGLGLWTPGGTIGWVVAPPKTPTRGPQIVEATVDANWIVWFESDFATAWDTPYVLRAQARHGGVAREIARSEKPPGGLPEQAIDDHHPVIVGDTLFWYDEVYQGGGPSFVVRSVPLDGSRPATVAVRGVMTMFGDRCAAPGRPALFVATGTDVTGHQELHRLTVDPSGSVATDQTVRGDLLGAAEDVSGVGACGDTVAVAHDVDEASANRGSWLEVDHGGEVRTFVWPFGLGSSIVDVTVGPDLVTWAMSSGTMEGARYVLGLGNGTLDELPQEPGFAHITSDGSFAWWTTAGDVPKSGHPVAARIAAG